MRGAAVNKLEDHFGRWKNREEIAEAMIPMIGRLYREKNVTTTVYSRSLVNNSVIQILKTHRFVKQIEDSELFESGLSVVDSFPILQEVTKLDLGPCRLDIGKLAVEYKKDSRGLSVEDYVREELGEAVNDKVDLPGQTDVVLYGFGRIGRLLARLLIEKTGSGDGLRLKAVVVRETGKGDLQKRARPGGGSGKQLWAARRAGATCTRKPRRGARRCTSPASTTAARPRASCSSAAPTA